MRQLLAFVRRGVARRPRSGFFAFDALGVAALVIVELWVLIRRAIESDIYSLAASVQDDSFYYVVPAFFFKKVGFFSFDGVTQTFGFQPLYEVILAFLATPFETLESFFRAALVLNAIFHVATAIAIVAALRRSLGSTPPAPLERLVCFGAAWFFLSNPYVIFSNATCKENALAGFLLALALYFLVGLFERKPGSAGRAVGATLGLLCLTRILPTTAVAASVVFSAAWTILPRRRSLVAFAFLPILAWSLYSSATFGTLVPTSARIKRLGVPPINSELAGGQEWSLIERAGEYAWNVARFSTGFESKFHLPRRNRPPESTGSKGWAELTWLRVGSLVLAALGAVTLLVRRIRSRTNPSAPLAIRWFWALGALQPVGLIAISLALRNQQSDIYYFSWYLYDSPVLLPIVAGITVLAALRSSRAGRSTEMPSAPERRRFSRPLVAMIVAALSLLTASCVWDIQPLPKFRMRNDWDDRMIRMGLLVRESSIIPSDARLGAFDSGVLGFLLPGRVINLDGLANDEVAKVLLDGGDLVEYFLSTGASYLVNAARNPLTADPRLSFESVKHFPLKFRGGYYLWRVRPVPGIALTTKPKVPPAATGAGDTGMRRR